MKVKEAIAMLSDHDPEAEVVLSRDGEGNSYSPLDNVSAGTYIAESSWLGDFHPDHEDFTPTPGPRAVCLWPVG